MTSSEVELLFEYVQRVEELKRIIATQIERLDELEAENKQLKNQLRQCNEWYEEHALGG